MHRQQRTRTLIQLGGLIDKAGLLTPLHLELGHDLQKDPQVQPDVHLLLGALQDLTHILSHLSEDEKKDLRSKGKTLLGSS